MPVLNLRSDFAAAPDLTEQMQEIGHRARAAARKIAQASAQAKDVALRQVADCLRASRDAILAENARDVAAATASGQTQALIDRLTLDEGRLAAMADAVAKIGALPDPVGRQLAAFERPNGLLIERIAVPLGVVGVIFESRPNVTADAGALCLKAGNAAILRAGSDSHRTAMAIARAMREGLEAAGLPADAVQIVPTRDRAAVGAMLSGLDGCIDVIVPRGGRGLVERVQAEAKVPVFAHLDGICHVYVAAGADLDMARTLVINSKMRRTGICGAAETLLVDAAVAETHLAPLVTALIEAGCSVRGDAATQAVDARVTAATEIDWRTEYLDAIIAVKGGGRARRRDRPYRGQRFAPYRCHRHGRRLRGGALPGGGRFGHRHPQRLDAIRRWRRVRVRRRDRHRHRAHACARPRGRGAADDLQVPGPRPWADPSLMRMAGILHAA